VFSVDDSPSAPIINTGDDFNIALLAAGLDSK